MSPKYYAALRLIEQLGYGYLTHAPTIYVTLENLGYHWNIDTKEWVFEKKSTEQDKTDNE